MKSIFRFFARMVVAIAIFGTATFITSCDVARQAQGAYNMVKCKYDFRSLTDVSVAGINTSKISFADAPKIMSLLSGNASSIPVDFVLNLAVTNPNSTEAFLNGLDYVLAIDGIDFTSGSVSQALSVVPGGTGILPLSMAFDVATLLKGETHDAVMGIITNLVGLSGLGSSLGLGSGGSGEPSKVTLNIRPSFNVGGYKVTSPVYIPVSFSFGGK